MPGSFKEWAKTRSDHPTIRRWVDRLMELGASWETFRRDPKNAVSDLMECGIPRLAAHDIVSLSTAALQLREAPMAIFWDLETMPIPLHSKGRAVVQRLKAAMVPYGDLIQFRGYANIGLGQISQDKRSDLHSSGCQLVDCPYGGRKEVADPKIVVDALQFAYNNPRAATLCFVLGEVDYADLFGVLKLRSQWRTIVISTGTLESMLHINCDTRIS
ncbi:hypothetical protein ACA910_001852 [Epithemia clementina (nom. ined.)]